jgi:hypothetical protein
MNKKVLKIVGIFLLLVVGCSELKVDTFQKWCELISGEDLKGKYAKFWVLKSSVSIDKERVRDDFIVFLNRSMLKKVQYKVHQMAWKKDNELHIVNLSGLLEIEPEVMIDKWQNGIKLALQQKHTDFADICIYGTVIRLFEILYIHTMKFDDTGSVIDDVVTPIQPN